MRKPKQDSQNPTRGLARHPLIGVWHNGDEFLTDVRYIVSFAEEFRVEAVDLVDNERAELFDITWDGDVLGFCVHWKSTGRFVRCSLKAVSPNRVEYRYTTSQTELWHREKRAKRKMPIARQVQK